MPQQQELPSEDEVFARFAQPKQAQAPAPPGPMDQSAKQVLYNQMGQVPLGLRDLAASFSPVRFRQGWTYPTFEIPSAVTGAATMAGHALSGNASGLMQDVMAPLHPYATLGREAGALADAYNVPGMPHVQAPTPPEMEQATRGATQNAAALIPLDIPSVAGRLRGAATRAGLPQRMAQAGTIVDEAPTAILPKWLRHPMTAAGPAMRAAGRALYDVTQDPKAQMPYVGEYIPPEGPTPPPQQQGPIDVPYRPAAGPPAAPPRQIGPYEQPKLPEGPEAPKQLAPVKPGTQIFEGQPGGMGDQPHVDVVANRPMIVRTVKGDGSGGVPGQMRLETPNEMRARLTNFGRGVTKQPTAEAQPYNPPKPPPKTRSAAKPQ